MFFFQEGFTFRNFFIDALTIFFFVVWFWLLFIVASDLWRRADISGWIKAIWVVAFIILPYIAVLAYYLSGTWYGGTQRATSAAGAR